ncbi:primosomal protein N' [Candidatus Saccharibacteria bacterium]|nr:primosomal protein N' [Candidatus Saccharibacteria bacterium]
MYYYEVLVASQRYHGDKALTYSSSESLASGRVITVPLQKEVSMGTVSKKVPKPPFATKPITGIFPPDIMLPNQLIDLTWWLKDYYPSGMGQIVTMLLPASLRQKSRQKAVAGTVVPAVAQHSLTSQQKTVVTAISSSGERMHLLHGETGSGKTRVYIELIKLVLGDDRSTILLTPEIGLTPQLMASVEAAYPGQTVVLHSNLTPAQRRDRWQQIASSKTPLIIVGPRSALFAPLRNVGLIILDEAHDTAYKQEQAPHYVASRVAAKLAELHGAKVVLGSATPLVSDYYTFEQKRLPIHRMTELATKGKFTSKIQVINLRDRELFRKSNWLSTKLLSAIEHNIENHTQSLIFLNRRGSARLVLCQSCGWQAACPRCDVPLTYHGDSHIMRCHTCGYSSSAPASCPSCASTDITFKSIGTKALESELNRLFSKARIMRFDSDNSVDDSLEKQFQTVKSGDVDIIIGTQLLAKGLDLPKLGLVGIIISDTGLYFPDYTAEERTYQLISQVIGRADRGHRDTEVIVQSYHPDNATLTHALHKDYQGFYANQLLERKNYNFPPYRFVLKIRVERASSASAEKAAGTIASKLAALGLRAEISSPAPAFMEKVHNRYRWQIVVKAVSRKVLLEIIQELPKNTSYDIDPTHLL